MKLKILFGLLLTAIIINMTYLDVGFNEFLSREPTSQSIDPLSYDLNYPDFSAEKIQAGQMSFDRLEGGTLKLGGKNNTNGNFSLADNNGVEKIIMDKDGIVVNEGNIIVKDDTNQSIIDSKGLVSVTNFKSYSAIDLEIIQTNIPNPGIIIPNTSVTFTLSRSSNILVFIRSVVGADINQVGQIRLVVDGVDNKQTLQIFSVNSGANSFTTSDSILLNLSEGTHVLKLKIYSIFGGNVSATYSQVIALILGS